MREAWIPRAMWRELPRSEHARAREAMARIRDAPIPGHAALVKTVANAPLPHTYRLRVGRHRILFAYLPDEDALIFTTAFMKRRPADYRRALVRHMQRLGGPT